MEELINEIKFGIDVRAHEMLFETVNQIREAENDLIEASVLCYIQKVADEEGVKIDVFLNRDLILRALEICTKKDIEHGKWEHFDFSSPTLKCSVCGELAGWDCCGDYRREQTDFCPNCGARMEFE